MTLKHNVITLTLLYSKWPKLFGVLVVLSTIGLNLEQVDITSQLYMIKIARWELDSADFIRLCLTGTVLSESAKIGAVWSGSALFTWQFTPLI